MIGFGGGSISGTQGGYGYGDVSENEAISTLQHAYENGITLFDTAPIYGFGASEQRIGKALSGNSAIRKRITIVTKLGVDWDENKFTNVSNSPETIHRMLEKSLRDLQTDYIDVYMIHWPDANTPIELTMKTLSDYKRAGVIRAIGASNFDTDLISKANKVDRIEVLQSEFNAFNNTNAKALFEYCKRTQTGFMAYGPLAKGILSGRVTKDRKYDTSDFRGQVSFVRKQAENLSSLQQRFLDLAKTCGFEPQVLATAYVLSRAEASVAIPGMKSVAQINSILPAVDAVIPQNILLELDNISEAATPLYIEAYNE